VAYHDLVKNINERERPCIRWIYNAENDYSLMTALFRKSGIGVHSGLKIIFSLSPTSAIILALPDRAARSCSRLCRPRQILIEVLD
jgi:hypothetical protein